MNDQSVLETSRLQLRPLALSDASAIQDAARAREVADAMISLPHPYPAGEAKRYIARQHAEREAGCLRYILRTACFQQAPPYRPAGQAGCLRYILRPARFLQADRHPQK